MSSHAWDHWVAHLSGTARTIFGATCTEERNGSTIAFLVSYPLTTDNRTRFSEPTVGSLYSIAMSNKAHLQVARCRVTDVQRAGGTPNSILRLKLITSRPNGVAGCLWRAVNKATDAIETSGGIPIGYKPPPYVGGVARTPMRRPSPPTPVDVMSQAYRGNDGTRQDVLDLDTNQFIDGVYSVTANHGQSVGGERPCIVCGDPTTLVSATGDPVHMVCEHFGKEA